MAKPVAEHVAVIAGRRPHGADGDARALRLAAVARAGWGCFLLAAPERLLRLGGRPPAPPALTTLARVLGARQLLQAALTAARPTARVATLSAAVDALHASTDLAFAVSSSRWRPAALVDTVVASALAASGRRAGRRR
jgi:hypothetical protein